jgi:hypothetical protein
MIMVDTPRLKIIPLVLPFSTLILAAFMFNRPGGTVAMKAAEKVAKKRVSKCSMVYLILNLI